MEKRRRRRRQEGEREKKENYHQREWHPPSSFPSLTKSRGVALERIDKGLIRASTPENRPLGLASGRPRSGLGCIPRVIYRRAVLTITDTQAPGFNGGVFC